MTHYRQCSGGNRHLFSHKLKWQRRSVQSDVLSACAIQAVLADLESNEPWYYPLFLLWMSTGLRNGEIRGLTWNCICWEEGELLVCKSLRRDGYSSGQHSWAPTKKGKERVVPLAAVVLEGVEDAPAADAATGDLRRLWACLCDTNKWSQCLRPLVGSGVEAFIAAMWLEAPSSLRPTP